MEKDNTKNEQQCAIHDVSTRFLCDVCGLEKFDNKKHKMYDENWNEQKGLNMCEDCYREGLGVS